MMVLKKNYLSLSFSLLFFFFLASCSNNYVEDIKRGEGYNYQPGHPELRIEVSGIINDNNEPKLLVAGSIPHNSLIFKVNDDKLIATTNISFEITNHLSGNTSTHNYPAKIEKSLESSVFDNKLFLFEQEFDAEPGNFTIVTSVTDLASQKTAIQTNEAYIPDQNDEISNITNIQILSKYKESDGEFFPVTTYDVTSSSDSIKFVFQVTNNKPGEALTFQSRLIKFRADTSVPRGMSFNNYSPSSLPYKGIDYDEFEIIQSSERTLNQPGNVHVEFAFKNLERGNYRFEVAPDLEEKGPLYKARDFSIKSKNYPSIKSAKELARPLVYLMDEDRYDELMKIKSEDSLKSAVDRFWLENIQNSALAKSVISLYYQRVEEANKYFSNYKEGWKTDQGMVYILFGPPFDIYKRLKTIRWSYRFNELDPENTYYFVAGKTKSPFYPFDNYLLQRQPVYFRVEYEIKELWLSGGILNRNI